ncbi:DUF397 domain-containing protein [Actinomadura sp. DSM 109109]|nr:DUF397 domain-containing protein [Actinomadura lepetitiana]
MDLNAVVWRKSSRSNESGDACIEVASLQHAVAIRDSKDAEGAMLIIGDADFRRLSEVLKKL